MTYRDYILALPNQFKYQPEIINKEKLKPFKRVVMCGMGGSRLAPDLLKSLYPQIDIRVCSDRYVPNIDNIDFVSETLFIANSHSGNTGETLAFAKMAFEHKLNLAVVGCGGALIELGQQEGIPHIITPTQGEPARLGIGYSMKALGSLMGIDLSQLGSTDTPAEDQELNGKAVAEFVGAAIPVVYVPDGKSALGYIWKTVLNETAKIPAFYNRYPELDHNEIASFDSSLNSSFRWIIIKDRSYPETADPLIKLLESKKLPYLVPSWADAGHLQELLLSIYTAHWTALAIAEKNGVDPLSTPAIEDFKKLI
jgi:glucose/mannose-6-phosphate isomerase